MKIVFTKFNTILQSVQNPTFNQFCNTENCKACCQAIRLQNYVYISSVFFNKFTNRIIFFLMSRFWHLILVIERVIFRKLLYPTMNIKSFWNFHFHYFIFQRSSSQLGTLRTSNSEYNSTFSKEFRYISLLMAKLNDRVPIVSGVSSKSKMSKFSFKRSCLLDFGIGKTPR